MNINYLQMDEVPEFEDGWQPVLDAMETGKFFSTTGEILLPNVRLNGKAPGEPAQATGKGMLEATVSWTFPLSFAEIVSGDGEQEYRERINLNHTEAFGKDTFLSPVNLSGKNWTRLGQADTADNGACPPLV